MTNSVNIDGLKDTFNSWSNALNQGDLDKFFGYFDDESETLDEDYPWRMNKADFVDHINFHAMGGGIGMWEFFEWIPTRCETYLNFCQRGLCEALVHQSQAISQIE